MTNGGIFIVINSSITDCIKFRTNPSYPSESAMCRIGVKLCVQDSLLLCLNVSLCLVPLLCIV